MAMIFADGFGHYQDADLNLKWDIVSDTNNKVAQSATGGRFGKGGVVFTTFNAVSNARHDQYLQKNYSGVSTVVCGMAFQQNATQTTLGGRLFALLDAATYQVVIHIMPSGQIRASRATTAGSGLLGSLTTLATSTNAISSSSYDYLEFKIVHHASNGSIEVKRNGVEAFWTVAGLNTAISGTATSSSLLLGGNTDLSTTNSGYALGGTVSDFYLLNTSGSAPDNDFLGDVQIETLFPTADGNYEEWALSAGADSFALVDDAPTSVDEDATHVSSSTVGHRDTFVVEDSSGAVAGVVKVVVLTAYCAKTTGGANTMVGMARLSATDADGTSFEVPNPYGFRQSFMTVKPGGGSWTVQDVNDSEFGFKKTV